MVEFSDLQFRLPDAFGQFDNSLNGKGTNPDHVMYENFGSVNQYFSDMSGGRYSPQFDLRPLPAQRVVQDLRPRPRQYHRAA